MKIEGVLVMSIISEQNQYRPWETQREPKKKRETERRKEIS